MALIAGEGSVWPEITRLASRSAHRRAAVAYIGKGGFDLLPMSDGNLLVVDCTPASARAGATYPAEITRFLNAGVAVHYRDGLHAKAFVFGGTAVIGSANASNHSDRDLTEAVVVTTDVATVRSTRKFIDELAKDSTEVTEEWIEQCQAVWREPRFAPRAQRSSEAGTILTAREGWALWYLHMEYYEPPMYVYDAMVQHLRSARRRTVARFRLETIGWSGRPRFRVGDLVIQVVYDDGNVRAYPPSVVEAVWFAKRGQQQRRQVATIKSITSAQPVAGKRIVRLADDHGFELADRGEQRVSDIAHRSAIMALWPSVQVDEQS
jgi:hypothetical protein